MEEPSHATQTSHKTAASLDVRPSPGLSGRLALLIVVAVILVLLILFGWLVWDVVRPEPTLSPVLSPQ